jgi:hypothetical protein
MTRAVTQGATLILFAVASFPYGEPGESPSDVRPVPRLADRRLAHVHGSEIRRYVRGLAAIAAVLGAGPLEIKRYLAPAQLIRPQPRPALVFG